MINFAQNYVLENQKVLLRPLAETDFEELLPFSTGEPDIWLYNAFGAGSVEGLKLYIEKAIAGRTAHTDFVFVVIDKAANKIVGSTRFYLINPITKTLELGYTWCGKQFQGTYINKNAKYLMLEFAFEVAGYERVGFKANIQNLRRINAMKKIGCKEEGILRSYSYDAKGNRVDMIVLSILKEEWYKILRTASIITLKKFSNLFYK